MAYRIQLSRPFRVNITGQVYVTKGSRIVGVHHRAVSVLNYYCGNHQVGNESEKNVAGRSHLYVFAWLLRIGGSHNAAVAGCELVSGIYVVRRAEIEF